MVTPASPKQRTTLYGRFAHINNRWNGLLFTVLVLPTVILTLLDSPLTAYYLLVLLAVAVYVELASGRFMLTSLQQRDIAMLEFFLKQDTEHSSAA